MFPTFSGRGDIVVAEAVTPLLGELQVGETPRARSYVLSAAPLCATRHLLNNYAARRSVRDSSTQTSPGPVISVQGAFILALRFCHAGAFRTHCPPPQLAQPPPLPPPMCRAAAALMGRRRMLKSPPPLSRFAVPLPHSPASPLCRV